jgi:hypothetical protein
MGRTAAVIWHASFSIAAGVLYFLFVLPRTLELLGDTSHTLGTALRIATGALIGLAALPVVFTLLRTRAPEFGTPKLALNLRTVSIALHVLAGVLIIAAAVSEIWLSLDSAGQWLFGIYGASAATALLGVFAFYLAFVAEMQPPPPKPLKVKERTSRRSRRADTAEDDAADEAVDETSDSDDADANSSADEVESADDGVKVVSDENDAEAATEEPALDESTAGEPEADGRLQNRRPTGKGTVLGRRKRTRGGVAVED